MIISWVKVWYLIALKRRQNQPARKFLRGKTDTAFNRAVNHTCKPLILPTLIALLLVNIRATRINKHIIDVSLIVINHTMVFLFTLTMTIILV